MSRVLPVIARGVLCPVCAAVPGEPCTDSRGAPRVPHIARQKVGRSRRAAKSKRLVARARRA